MSLMLSQVSSQMTSPSNLLNPALYTRLMQAFPGGIEVSKPGVPVVIVHEYHDGELRPAVAAWGEAYCVCCPICGGSKHKLYVSYAFGSTDKKTGKKVHPAICWRHSGSVTQLVLKALEYISAEPLPEMSVTSIKRSEISQDVFVAPGNCIRLDQKDSRVDQARQYLVNRGIDPDEAAAVYGFSVCVEGNQFVYNGVMQGRLILPVTFNGTMVGWQGRLTYDPPAGEKSFRLLRYISMPGAMWRVRSLMGLDQARMHPVVIPVEGPLDMAKQGPPCVASMGQNMSSQQYDLITSIWDKPEHRIILVGDSGEEDAIRKNSNELKRRTRAKVYAPQLPHGDPGSWSRQEFAKFLADDINSGRSLVK